MLPLTTANLLAHAIIGSVLENLDMERLIREVGQAVAQRILGNQESVDDVARELHERLLLRNESTKKIVFDNIYKESAEAKHNVQVFTEAPNLSAARPLLKKVSQSRTTTSCHSKPILFRFMVADLPTSTLLRVNTVVHRMAVIRLLATFHQRRPYRAVHPLLRRRHQHHPPVHLHLLVE